MTMYFETMILNAALTDIVKITTKRTRPFVYILNSYDDVLRLKHPEDASLSFYSGHTSTVAATSFFMARTITLNETDKTKKTFIWISAATIPAV